MRLDELFDRKADWEVTRSGPTKYEATIDLSNRTIVFSAVRTPDDPEWYLDFYEKTDSGIRFDMTGSGDEFLVMSTIKEVISDFVNKCSPEKFYFTADRNDASRVSAYGKMIKRYVPPQYKATITQKPNSDAVYRFIKESRLDELFDNTYEFQVTSRSEVSWVAEFRTQNDNLIRFKASGYQGDWEVVFSGGSENERTYDVTGSGDAFKVMSTIVKILEYFVNQTHPDRVQFTGSYHSGHAKLYDRMMKSMNLPGYTKSARDSLNSADRIFSLTRDKSNAS